MNSRGFTLVELLVVIALIVTLTTFATLSWNTMSMKTAIEGEVKTIHADMMATRLEALYQKRSRSVVVSGTNFSIYSSSDTTGTPISSRTLKYSFVPAGANTVTFDTSGMTNGTQITLCVDAFHDLLKNSDASVDSLVISQARLNLGKRDEGGNCNANDVKQK